MCNNHADGQAGLATFICWWQKAVTLEYLNLQLIVTFRQGKPRGANKNTNGTGGDQDKGTVSPTTVGCDAPDISARAEEPKITDCFPPWPGTASTLFLRKPCYNKSHFWWDTLHTVHSELLFAPSSPLSLFPWLSGRWSLLYTGHGLSEDYFIIFIIIHSSHFRFSFLQKRWCTNRCGALWSMSRDYNSQMWYSIRNDFTPKYHFLSTLTNCLVLF